VLKVPKENFVSKEGGDEPSGLGTMKRKAGFIHQAQHLKVRTEFAARSGEGKSHLKEKRILKMEK